MASFDVFDHSKNVTGQVELDDSVFGASINDFFLHQVLVSYTANKRQGTHKAKNRNEVHGTNRKPFRQKGTGRARQGTMHAPHHRSGARQFGPTPRSYRQSVTKKMKQEAFRQTLSLKADRGGFYVLSDLQFPEIKTKQASQLLNAFGVEKGKVLFLDVNPDNTTVLSVRNLQKTSILPASMVSPLDIFESDHLFVTKAAAELFVQRYAKEKRSVDS